MYYILFNIIERRGLERSSEYWMNDILLERSRSTFKINCSIAPPKLFLANFHVNNKKTLVIINNYCI